MSKIFTLILVLITINLSAQPIVIDDSFNPQDIGDGNATWVTGDMLRHCLIQSDGKIIVAGNMSRYRNRDTEHNGIARLNSDGSVDTTFQTGSGTAGPTGKFITQVVQQPDGKLIIGGAFASFNGISRSRIARLNTDGSLDATFDPGTGFNNNAVVYAICLLPSGKMIVGGSFYNYNGTAVTNLVCINSDGSLDAGFSAAIPSGQIFTIKRQTDGNILVGGSFTSYNSSVVGNMVRIDSTGGQDVGFLSGLSGANNRVNIITIQPDGQILVGGNFTNFNSTSKNRLVRLDVNGALDNSFSNTNNFNNNINTIEVLTDNRIAVGGAFTYFTGTILNNRITVLGDDGIRDAAFYSHQGFDGQVFWMTQRADGKLLVAGSFRSFQNFQRNSFAIVNEEGSSDTIFEMGGLGPSFTVNTITQALGGGYFIGGNFPYYNNEFNYYFVKTNSDGSIDTTMKTQFNGGEVFSIKELADSSILVAGNFTTYKGYTKRGLIKLNAKGDIDTAFALNNTIGPGAVYDITLQSDGKILIGGAFTTVNAITVPRLARLNADGTLDAGFTPPSGQSNIRKIAVLPDGKIMVAGGFVNWNGTGVDYLARLNGDGSIDGVFNMGTGGSDIRDILVQPDGKVIIAGGFSFLNGAPVNRIARLQENGSLDASFSVGAGYGADWLINSIQLQADGKVLIGGDFTNVGGVPYSKVARINADGSVDNTFDIGSGFGVGFLSNNVNDILLSEPNHLMVVGRFGSYNGIGKNAIVRLMIDDIPTPLNFLKFDVSKTEGNKAKLDWQVTDVKENSHFEIQKSGDGINFVTIDRVYDDQHGFEFISNYRFIDVDPMEGTNFYRIKQIDFNGNSSYTLTKKLEFINVNNISVSPNPAAQFININGLNEGSYTLQIYDINGRLVAKKGLFNTGITYQYNIDNLTNGTYLLRIISNNNSRELKFIKK